MEKTFFYGTNVLYTIMLAVFSVVGAIYAYNTEGAIIGLVVLLTGLLCTVVFCLGLSTFIEKDWKTDQVGRILFSASMIGVFPTVVGLYGVITTPTELTEQGLYIGAVLFAAPVFIAALWGLVLYAKQSIRLFAWL